MITQTKKSRVTVYEADFPVKSYANAKTRQERGLICEKASTLDEPDLSPQSTEAARVLFEGMSDADKQKTFRRLGVQETLERIGFEVVLAPPWDRSTRLHRNGKPA